MAGVYKITNKVNGKVYIGCTSARTDRRFLKHLALSKRINQGIKHSAIHKAINEFGEANFTFEVLFELGKSRGVTKEEYNTLQNLEKHYIELYNAYGDGGYNQSRGGEGGVGAVRTTEHRELLRQANIGKKLTMEHRRKISEGLKKNHGGLSARGLEDIKTKNTYPVMLFSLDTGKILGFFKSTLDLAEYLGLTLGTVRGAFEGRKSKTLCIVNGEYLNVCTIFDEETKLRKIDIYKNNFSKRHATKIPTLVLKPR